MRKRLRIGSDRKGFRVMYQVDVLALRRSDRGIEQRHHVRIGRIRALSATTDDPISGVLNAPACLISENLPTRNVNGSTRGRISLSGRVDAEHASDDR
jgi:hypothetical protein